MNTATPNQGQQQQSQRVHASAPTADDMKLFRQTLQKMEGELKAALPPQIPVDRFIRITVTAVQMNPDLLVADRTSLIASTMKAAQDGLLCDGREAVLNVYNTKIKDGNQESWIKKVQYMPMVEGMLKKVRQSGATSNIIVEVVHENDEFDYQLGDNPFIKHKPAKKNRGTIIGAYSIVKLITDEMSREWMDIDQIMAIMRRSKSQDKDGNPIGPWKTDFSEMCRKTVFRRHYKRLPKSTDIDIDQVIQHDNETFQVDRETGELTPVAQPQRQPAAAITHQPEQPMNTMSPVQQQGMEAYDVLPADNKPAQAPTQQQTAQQPSPLSQRMAQGANQTFQDERPL